jgi:hypothetical protein
VARRGRPVDVERIGKELRKAVIPEQSRDCQAAIGIVNQDAVAGREVGPAGAEP